MNSRLRVKLTANDAQATTLQSLQAAFAEVCNAISPVAAAQRVWSRVGLHHLVYRPMREKYPALGSQMVCNAIYSVAKACRLVYQGPSSPFNVRRTKLERLPVLRFEPLAPVYFDRHTLSLRDGSASLFTMEGRMRFHLPLTAEDERRFHEERLLEVMLSRDADGYALHFSFGPAEAETPVSSPAAALWPDYLQVQPVAALSLAAQARGSEPPALLSQT